MMHGSGIFTYNWLIFMVNVGKRTSPMDPMPKGSFRIVGNPSSLKASHSLRWVFFFVFFGQLDAQPNFV